MKTIGEEPIYPILHRDGTLKDVRNLLEGKIAGLTKREYFAAMAMQGLLAKHGINHDPFQLEISIEAVLSADDLIEELNK